MLVHDYLSATAGACPDKIALIAGAKTISFREGAAAHAFNSFHVMSALTKATAPFCPLLAVGDL